MIDKNKCIFLMLPGLIVLSGAIVVAQDFDDDEFFLDDEGTEVVVEQPADAEELDLDEDLGDIEEELEVMEDDSDDEIIEDMDLDDDVEEVIEEVEAIEEEVVDDLDSELGLGDEEVVDAVEDKVAEESTDGADIDSLVESAFKEAIQEGKSESARMYSPEQAQVMITEDMEISKRRANELHGLALLAEAKELLLLNNYEEAIKKFEASYILLGIRAGLASKRIEAKKGLQECSYQLAIIYLKAREFENAKSKARTAISQGHPDAPNLMARILQLEEKPAPKVKPPAQRVSTKDYADYITEVRDRLKKARQHIQTSEYELARDHLEAVMKRDPVNTEAIRLMNKVSQIRYDSATLELEDTRKEMMSVVRQTWNPRTYAVMEVPAPEDEGPINPDETAAKIRKKMEDIVIPQVEFRAANIRDVVDELTMLSREYDPEVNLPEEMRGVNIILNLAEAGAGGGSESLVDDDPFATTTEDASSGSSSETPITFNTRGSTLYEILEIVTELARLQLRINGRVVMIVPENAPVGEIINRDYAILPTFIDRVDSLSSESLGGGFADEGAGGFADLGGGDEGGGDDQTDKLKTFFMSLGVKWPNGSSIRFISTIGRLVVANTEQNLARLEKVLALIDVVPSQIEIETRFVEVLQQDLSSLGLETALTDDFELAANKRDRGRPVTARQRIVMGANDRNGGFSVGNRFVNDGVLASLPGMDANGGAILMNDDRIMSIAGILTNPEMALVLHAMDQKGFSDLLSAPKVTTQSGSEATIKVVTEYIYPTEFTVTPIMGASAAGVATIVGGVVEPGSFETREVGVLLTVLPEVSADSQMINLTMTPEVVTDPLWKDYGSRFTDAEGHEQILPMPQPFFKSRSVVTTVNIYNGATVMMGGMITEDRASVDDRIPFFGDLPIIGRLFRSKYDKSDKKNLLIFVTARLVDPAGRPLFDQSSKLTGTDAANEELNAE